MCRVRASFCRVLVDAGSVQAEKEARIKARRVRVDAGSEHGLTRDAPAGEGRVCCREEASGGWARLGPCLG